MVAAGRASVAAIVVTYNGTDVIVDCLKALAQALDGVQRSVAVVVENASDYNTYELVARTAPNAHVLRLANNRGYAAGINAGAAATVEVDALLALTLPGTGITVPKLIGPDGQAVPSLKLDRRCSERSARRCWAGTSPGASMPTGGWRRDWIDMSRRGPPTRRADR
jgi:glycosyltransferase involved in cell wall biosynthesis